jgi:homoserine kinase type II
MDHLAARGFRCPTPIHGRDGQALRELCGRPAAIISFLEGLWPRTILAAHCVGVGDVLARLHLAGGDFTGTRVNALSLPGWHALFDQIGGRADEVEAGLAGEIAAELAALDALWPTALPAGVVHADLFPDNVFFRDEAVSGVIDFYFACADFYAYDLAICLNAWCFDPAFQFVPDHARNLVTAYRKVRPLDRAEAEALPVLARGAALRFLLTRLYDWLNPQEGALVRPKDPREYLAKLRFHRAVTGAEAYGF